jgi:hypothetical protein
LRDLSSGLRRVLFLVFFSFSFSIRVLFLLFLLFLLFQALIGR